MSEREDEVTPAKSDEHVDELPPRVIDDADASSVKGGATAAGSLDPGIQFKYDLKAQKEG